MEQPCYKCGQVVEQGIPFCPHCSAPQIRVVVAEPVPALAAAAEGGTTSQGALPASQTVPVLALPMSWSQALKPCALAVVVASLLMVLGLNSLVAMLSIGFLAVAFYRRRKPDASIRAIDGAGLGALGGILWFGMFLFLLTLLVVALREAPGLQDQLLQQLHQAASSPSASQIQEFLDHTKTASGLAGMVLSALVSALILGTLGGALGGAVFGRRDKS